MSEFRKYRLVTKLLDCFGISESPQDYVPLMGQTSPPADQGAKLDSALDVLLDALIPHAKDVSRLQQIVEEQRSDGFQVELWHALELMRTVVFGSTSSSMASPSGNIQEFVTHQKSSAGQFLRGRDAVAAMMNRDMQSHRSDAVLNIRDATSPEAVVTPRNDRFSAAFEPKSPFESSKGTVIPNSQFSAKSPYQPSSNVFNRPTTPQVAHQSQFNQFQTHEEYSNEQLSALGIRVLFVNSDSEWRADRHSLALQEMGLVQDALFVLSGLSGRFLQFEMQRCTATEAVFCADSTLGRSFLAAMVPILAACVDYVRLDRFISRRNDDASSGRVSQALVGYLEEHLDTYHRAVASLEASFTDSQGGLGIQQLLFQMQPHMQSLSRIAQIISVLDASALKGGSILVHLENAVAKERGDRNVRQLLEGLLLHCARPYLNMLSAWIYHGRLEDDHMEFMIRRRTPRDPLSYGEDASTITGAFVIVDGNVPPSLQGPMASKVLRVGAYHSILSGFGSTQKLLVQSPSSSGASLLTYDARQIALAVERELVNVNRRVMDELLAGDRLLKALTSCKRYYFGERSDLLHSFLDASQSELNKPIGAVIKEQLEYSWECLLKSSSDSIGEDSEKRLCIALSAAPLDTELLRIMARSGDQEAVQGSKESQHRGIDYLTVRLRFGFPESLIFGAENLAKYEFIFRLQLQLARISRALSSIRIRQLGTSSATLLRRQMMHFVQSLHQYLAYDVIEPHWERLISALSSAQGMDAVLALHLEFIDSCLRHAMLSNARLVRHFSGLFDCCHQFVAMSDHQSTANTLDHSSIGVSLSSLQDSWTMGMRQFLDLLQHYSSRGCEYHLGTLFARLDYNSYYLPSSTSRHVSSSSSYHTAVLSSTASNVSSSGGGGGMVN